LLELSPLMLASSFVMVLSDTAHDRSDELWSRRCGARTWKRQDVVICSQVC
jgi:hypothetical protein